MAVVDDVNHPGPPSSWTVHLTLTKDALVYQPCMTDKEPC